jgi:hypothetical protein
VNLTTSDLERNGISGIERLLQDAQEVLISLRGKPRDVVVDIALYDFLRECKITAALAQARADLAAGRCRRENPNARIWIDGDGQRSRGVISMRV